jgi:hypothetical protein
VLLIGCSWILGLRKSPSLARNYFNPSVPDVKDGVSCA